MEFAELVDWTKRPEDGIRSYSGTAAYRKTFNAPEVAGRLFLDLGDLAMLAEVRLNGRNLGAVWFPPFRVDITSAVKPTGNVLEVDVVNGWYNRLARDSDFAGVATVDQNEHPAEAGREAGGVRPARAGAAIDSETRGSIVERHSARGGHQDAENCRPVRARSHPTGVS